LGRREYEVPAKKFWDFKFYIHLYESQKSCCSNSNLHGPKYTMLAIGKT
jgi:hypothetical protein